MIGISLVVKDAKEWVQRLSLDIRSSDLGSYPLNMVAVDNASKDGTAEVLTQEGWTVLRMPTNVGIVAARNYSLWRLAADPSVQYALEVHADMRFPAEWFTPLLAAMTDPDVWISCPKIVTGMNIPLDICCATREIVEVACRRKLDGEWPDSFGKVKLNHPCLHRMAPFKDRGFYDDRILWQEFEDTDLYYEWTVIRRKEVRVVPTVAVYHQVAGQRLEQAPTRHWPANLEYLRVKWGPDWMERISAAQDPPG